MPKEEKQKTKAQENSNTAKEENKETEENKPRMAESGGDSKHQLQDKGYKKLFQNKEMFIEFLQTFVKEEWVKDINEDDLIRVDKEYILQDYKKKEADIVYKMKLKDTETSEVNEVIFYMLMELQSSVDRLMPYRLLMYMVQIWKQELTNVQYRDAQEKDYKLPTIVPLVLYNGSSKWDVKKNFKDLQEKSNRFGAYTVDFKYILVETNSYDAIELQNIANAISCIIMMDQKVVARDKKEMRNRLEYIRSMKGKLTPEKMNLIFEWLKEVLLKRLPNKEAKEIIENAKEVEAMTYALERLIDNEVEKAVDTGAEKARIETAKEMIINKEPMEKIIIYSKLTTEKIEEVRQKLNKEHIHQ